MKSGEEKDAFGYLGDKCSRDLLHNMAPYGLDTVSPPKGSDTEGLVPQAVVGGEAF